MPPLYHFHPPLYPTHRWESFHARWAVAIADALNETLSSRYFAETQMHLGSRVEAGPGSTLCRSLPVPD